MTIFRQTTLVLVLMALGCSGAQDPRRRVAPVTGRILFHGKPVVDAQVTFHPTGAPRQAIGKTDDAGRFQLSTWGRQDGAPLGDHVVTVTQPQGVTTALHQLDDASYANAMQSAQPQPAMTHLPRRYTDPRTTDLRCHVVAGAANEFQFELHEE